MNNRILETMAYLVKTVGMFCGQPIGEGTRFLWSEDEDMAEPAMWLDLDGVVHLDINEVKLMFDGAEPYYAVIGWCVANRVECLLHSHETTRKAWRP